MKDYYKILGIEKNASEEEVKKAYRRLAHEHHPDKKSGNADKFKEINEAYQVLSNKDKRASYDRFGTADFGGGGFAGGPFGGGPGFDFGNIHFEYGAPGDMGNLGDIFDAFFEGMGVKEKRREYKSGADLELHETISLEEAFRGESRRVSVDVLISCEVCKGRGYDHEKGVKKCVTCAGRGEVRESRRTFFGNFSQVRACEDCKGTGEVPNSVCAHCKGEGRIRGKKDLAFQIIPGIEDGQIIKIKGAGEAGARGAASGDMYVRVKIEKHARFERTHADLALRHPLNIVKAFLGEKVELKGIDGKTIAVEIPAGHNLREPVRVRGEGMPHFGGSGRGDLYVSFDIVMPKKISAKAKELLEKLRGEIL